MKRPLLFAFVACALGIALAAAMLLPRERVAALRGTSSPDVADSAVAAVVHPSAEAPEASAVEKAPTAERSAVERRVRFLVRDERGGAIEGASLRLSSSEACAELARTDAEGRASLIAAGIPKARAIWVSAPSYATAFVETDAIESDPVELTLRTGGWVAGVVRRTDGAPAGADVMLFALPLDELEGRDPTDLERLFCREALSARTDAGGRFRIDDLVEGRSYGLVGYRSSASGWSCVKDRRIVANASDAELELREVYAARLRFTCANEEHMRRFFRDPKVEVYASGGLGSVAGFEPVIASNLAGWNGALRADGCEPLLYSGAEGLDVPQRTVWCHVEIPGFAPVRERVELAPVRDDRVVEHRIELLPDAQGAGSLLISLTGPYGELAARMGLEAKLALYRAPDDRITTYTVRWNHGERDAQIRGVPTGIHRWTAFMGLERLRPRPPLGQDEPRLSDPFAITDGAEARLELELPPIAYLELECRRDGAPMAASVSIHADPEFEGSSLDTVMKSRWTKRVQVRGTTETIGPLSPGSYGLGLEESGLVESWLAIELAAGESKHVVLDAP